MDNEQPSASSTPLTYTMRYGLVTGACFTANFLLSAANNMQLAMLTYLISLYVWIFTYKNTCTFRDKACKGAIGYWSVVSYIAMLFFFGSLIAGTIMLIYTKYISPDYLNNLFDQSMLLLEEIGIDLPEPQIDQLHNLLRPSNYVLQFIAGKCLGGCLLGMLYAFFIRKQADV
ncbi:MAG: DUF4199 domain-containing protein [Paludibacter sp.]|nr:DUF4199 domain-containing protein [Bacteroidales bacterium]MCM1069498.1 DUF4199 domain-containing protein [Prevotella sp.]MCM1354154.1 DUF4199 domain-containing protein [Bacteroides sp.]MCM1442989.1 DUF4199 domain-containing protein [Muribaculum sp.]MCM1482229.1 DUF4199 domain-containing protein [Paludibacter sp.]